MRWLAPGADLGSWYPNRFWDPVEANEPYLTEAVERCDEAVREAAEVDTDKDGRLGAEKLAIIGFSQGACVAMEYARRHPGRVGTLIVFTGGLMGVPGTHVRGKHVPGKPALQGLHVLLTGSDADDWIPEASTRESAEVLRQLGAQVTLRIYHGRPHVVGDEELAEARALLEGL